MQKIKFTEFAEIKQGDGLGPKYLAGKAYWLSNDQAERWKAEGIAVAAPADMQTENERGAEPVRDADVRLVLVRGGRYDVVAHGYVFNPEPLKASDAERLRKDVLEGKVVMPTIAPESQAPAPEEPAADLLASEPKSEEPVEKPIEDHPELLPEHPQD